MRLCGLQVCTAESKCVREEPEGRRENGDVCISDCECADMMTYGREENRCEWVIYLSFRSEGVCVGCTVLGEKSNETKEQVYYTIMQTRMKISSEKIAVN